VAEAAEREARRSAAFARLQPSFPVSISITDVELPGGARLDDDEFVVRTSKDWGLTLKPLVLTTRRLVCPSDLTGRTAVSLRLTDVRSVRLSKHAIGFSTIVVETFDQRPVSFAAHINGLLVRSDIAATVDHVQRTTPPSPSAAASSPSHGDRYEQLRRIGALRESGVLSEAEFEEEKARILKQP
jgi:hypothetical protein